MIKFDQISRVYMLSFIISSNLLHMDPEHKLVTYTALAIVAEEGIGPLQ